MKFHAPPTVATFPSGKFIVGVTPWIPYTPEKFAEIESLYEKELEVRRAKHKEIEESMTTKQVEVVSNSDPTKKYMVTVYDDKLECTCKGYSFRGTCSHINQVKATL
jgi:hypothetical protein